MALYIDSLCNNTMAKTMTALAPINVSFMADYPDFLALALVLIITGKITFITSIDQAVFIFNPHMERFFRSRFILIVL